MTRYVITIAPDATGTPDAANAQTTVRVDTSSGDARITELTVRAASGGGIAPADLPAFDLDLLIRALSAPSAVRALPATAHNHPDVPEDGAHPAAGPEADEPVATGQHASPTQSATPDGPAAVAEPVGEDVDEVFGSEVDGAAAEPVRPARGRAGRKATARKAAGTKAPGRKAAAKKATSARKAAAGRSAAEPAVSGGRKATGAKAAARGAVRAKTAGRKATGRAAGAKATGAKATAAQARREGVRAYRRMPEPAEVLAAYTESGSITGLAQHYGVPRHTANGWARRLRQQGHAIGRK